MDILLIIVAFLIGGGIVWLLLRNSKVDTSNLLPIEQHEAEVSTFKSQVEKLNKSINLADEEIKRLHDEAEDIKKQSEEQLKQQEKSLKEQYESIVKRIQDENARLDSALKMASEGKVEEGLLSRLAEAEKSAAVLNDLEIELAELKRQHESLLSEHAPLKTSLEEVTSKYQTLNKKVKQLEDEIEEAEDEQEELEKKLKNKTSELQSIQEELEKSSKSNKKLQEDLRQREDELSERIDELKRKKSSIEFVQAILSADISKTHNQNLFKTIDNIESFLNGQFTDCNAFLFNSSYVVYGDKKDSEASIAKRNYFLQRFNEWAAAKRKSWLDNKITIAFVGEFSAGKTSIVNRILSQDNPNVPLLPVSMKATTAIPTYIAGGFSESYNFVSPSDEIKTIRQDIFRMVSKEVLDEIKGVSSLIKYFVMTYKNPNLNGLSILDTPGFNSNDAEDKDRTIDVINECDALFWVFDVNAGTVNRSSIKLIKEKLNKPLIVVINKVDTKSPSDVDKVEKLIRKTLSEEGLNVEKFVRFSSKAPLDEIMKPIHSIKRDETRDEFISTVSSDIDQMKKIMNDHVRSADNKYHSCESKVAGIVNSFNSGLRSLWSDCEMAAGIPQWTTHTFSKDRYEMNREEGQRLINILDNLSTTRCNYLTDCFNRELEAVAEEQQAYSDLLDCKTAWQKVEDCKKEFNRIIKNLK